MKKTLLCLFTALFFQVGCSQESTTLSGNYSRNASFNFELPSSSNFHTIKVIIIYTKKSSTSFPILEGKLKVTLTDPEGAIETKMMFVKPVKGSKALKNTFVQSLFKVVPQNGTYTLSIKEDEATKLLGKTIKIKIIGS